MDLFNKKQLELKQKLITSLNQDINLLVNEIAKLERQNNELQHRNEKLVNWLFKLIESNGFEIPERVPYFKMVNTRDTIGYPLNPGELGDCREEHITIPTINIVRVKRG